MPDLFDSYMAISNGLSKAFGLSDQDISNFNNKIGYNGGSVDFSKVLEDLSNNMSSAVSMMDPETYMQREYDLLDKQFEQNSALASQANKFAADQADLAWARNQQATDLAWERTKQMAEESNQFSHDEQQLNRDFQLMMSNSAIQRQVADYEAAGLNPYLAYAAGGAPVTSGGAASPSFASAGAASASPASGHSASVSKGSNIIPKVENMLVSLVSSAFKIGAGILSGKYTS